MNFKLIYTDMWRYGLDLFHFVQICYFCKSIFEGRLTSRLIDYLDVLGVVIRSLSFGWLNLISDLIGCRSF